MECVTSPWLCGWCGEARGVNARLSIAGLSVVAAEGEEWRANQLLLADDAALMTDIKKLGS